MNLPIYEFPVIKKIKPVGTVTILLKQITQIKYKNKSDYNELTPFTYRVYKKGIDGNSKLNVILSFNDKQIYLKLSRFSRKKLHLMFKDHWYFNNFITRFYIKFFRIIDPVAALSIAGFKLYKAIGASIAGFALFKGCD